MDHHQSLKAFICVFLGILFITACTSPTQPAALPTAVPATAIPPTAMPPTATATITPIPIPPTSTSTPTSMPPTATQDPTLGRIEGKIIRSDTNQPFANTSVLLRDANYNVLLSTTTDTQGAYVFPTLKAGTYSVSVEMTFSDPVLSGCSSLKQSGADWYFTTEVDKNGQQQLTGLDALSIPVAAGEIIEKNLTLICE